MNRASDSGNGVKIAWEIHNEGRSWRAGEAMERYMLTPEKFEMVNGKLLSSDGDREVLLGLLLENVGADIAVKLGDPRSGAAVRKLDV